MRPKQKYLMLPHYFSRLFHRGHSCLTVRKYHQDHQHENNKIFKVLIILKMGSLTENSTKITVHEESDSDCEEANEELLTGEIWSHKNLGNDDWHLNKNCLKDRMDYLRKSKEMSDLDILACDENWWFGDTVKDYTVNN